MPCTMSPLMFSLESAKKICCEETNFSMSQVTAMMKHSKSVLSKQSTNYFGFGSVALVTQETLTNSVV